MIIVSCQDQADGSVKQSSSSNSSVAGAACINVVSVTDTRYQEFCLKWLLYISLYPRFSFPSKDCTNVRQFTVDSHQMIELNKFFDKVWIMDLIILMFFSSYLLCDAVCVGD